MGTLSITTDNYVCLVLKNHHILVVNHIGNTKAMSKGIEIALKSIKRIPIIRFLMSIFPIWEPQ
jgi:hypothetical protein